LGFGNALPILFFFSLIFLRFVSFFFCSQLISLLSFFCGHEKTNVASGNSEQTKMVVDYGVVSEFIRLLNSPSKDVQDQAVWGLGNIAGDSPQMRNLALSNGAMKALLDFAVRKGDIKTSLLRTWTWALSNLCR
jgi:hypothetical protein